MGGSSTGSISKIIRNGTTYHAPIIQEKITNAVASNVQSQIISQVLGATIATQIGTLTAGLSLIKLAWDMYVAGKDAYDRTHDENEAITAAAGVLVDKAISVVKSEAIRTVVGLAVNQQSSGNLDATSKNILVDSISGVVEELIK